MLYTSVSSALETLCPAVTNSGLESCGTGTVAVPGIDFQENTGGNFGEGELVISVLSSSYNSTAMRDSLIVTAAQVANTTSLNNGTNSNCQDYWQDQVVKCENIHECDPGDNNVTKTLCNAAPFAGAQFYDGSGKVFYLDALWEFQEYSGGPGMICEDYIDAVTEVVTFIAPEFAPEVEAAVNEHEFLLTCESLVSIASAGPTAILPTGLLPTGLLPTPTT
jgi:hypothetical protein